VLTLWFVNTKSYTLSIKTELSKRNLSVYTWTLRFIVLIKPNTECILKDWCHQVISCPRVDLNRVPTMWIIFVSMDVVFENRSYTNYYIYSLSYSL